MKKENNFWQRLADAADLPGEDIPGQSVVEIAGDSRVLIEHHRGVSRYSREEIGVNVSFGWISVKGGELELIWMAKEQLVIRGRIDSVTLKRRR